MEYTGSTYIPAGVQTALNGKLANPATNDLDMSGNNIIHCNNLTFTYGGPGKIIFADDSSLNSAIGIGGGTVTAVTGTAPIASSGGATPAISLDISGTAGAGKVLGYGGSVGTLQWTTPSVTPAIPTNAVQYNDAGAFSGSSNFTYTDAVGTTSALGLNGCLNFSRNIVVGRR